MNSSHEAWLNRLTVLAERFSHLGIGGDIAAMTLIELWALYLYLTRLTET